VSGVIEITRLEDLVTLDPPPCEMHIGRSDILCGKPSVYRLARECACGLKSTRFLCAECYAELIKGGVSCHVCLRPVDNWRHI